jgi:hypothetical protein
MVLGTKKPNVVETKLFSSEKIYDWGKKTKDVGTNFFVPCNIQSCSCLYRFFCSPVNLWLREQKIYGFNKSMDVITKA